MLCIRRDRESSKRLLKKSLDFGNFTIFVVFLLKFYEKSGFSEFWSTPFSVKLNSFKKVVPLLG
jgi:hypothetical protein